MEILVLQALTVCRGLMENKETMEPQVPQETTEHKDWLEQTEQQDYKAHKD